MLSGVLVRGLSKEGSPPPPLSLRFLPQSVLTLSRNEGAGGEHTAPGRAMKLSGREEVTPHLTEVTISQDNNNFDSSVYLI